MLSIVIPSYNDAKNIPLAIASADQIKYVSEIIIVDDCSNDNSLEVINKSISDDKRFKLFSRKKNYGVIYF